MNLLDQIASKIISEQELVIGPLAWSEAKKVPGLTIDMQTHQATISDAQPTLVVDKLVAQYERLFGRASQEVCREAVASMLSSFAPADIPLSLRA